MNIIYPYKTQKVRDLAWACFSPALLDLSKTCFSAPSISSCGLALSPARQSWLAQLDRDSSALDLHLSRRPTHRLGIYFEQLWHFFLQQDPEIELICHNLPIQHQGRTLGEFDCLYYCYQRKHYIHLELAVKYFLRLPRAGDSATSNGLSEWVGPDNRDRLDLKLQQLLQRQILLGDHPAAQQTLTGLGIDKLSKEIALKGYLFQAAPHTTGPEGYNYDCRLNSWVSFNKIRPHCSTLNATTYLIPPKMKWLSPIYCDHACETMTEDELQTHLTRYFAQDYYPLLIAALDDSGNELSRFFATSKNWPDITN